MGKIWAIMKIQWQYIAEYRLDSLVYTVGNVVFPIIMLSIWLKISQSAPQELPYSRSELITYYVALGFVQLISGAWMAWEIDEDVRLGRLSTYLVKPVSYFWHLVSGAMAEKIFRLVYIVPFLIIVGWTFKVDWPGDGVRLLTFALVLTLSGILASLWSFTLGLFVFWLGDVRSLLSINGLLSTVFSGAVIPLAFFPDLLHAFAAFAPYRFIVSFPLEVLLGHQQGVVLLTSVFVQLGWIGVVLAGYRLLWRLGIRQYQAVGS